MANNNNGMRRRGEEYLERINYLFQAADTVAESYPDLGKYYGKVLRTISEKTPAKLDFTMKRSFCRNCDLTLTSGALFTYRLRRRKGRKGYPTQIITCKSCKSIKKFPTRPNYELRTERDGKIV